MIGAVESVKAASDIVRAVNICLSYLRSDICAYRREVLSYIWKGCVYQRGARWSTFPIEQITGRQGYVRIYLNYLLCSVRRSAGWLCKIELSNPSEVCPVTYSCMHDRPG